MKVLSAYSFLVHPAKHLDDQPKIGGTEIPLDNDVGVLLSAAFIRAGQDCKIDISFDMAEDGTQHNQRRTMLLSLLTSPSIYKARAFAEALQKVTTNRSGLGLFFVLTGASDDGEVKKAYLCRFPADNGIVAEENEQQLQVDFLEQVFLKNAMSYKAVMYEGHSLTSDFWQGRAVDKQVSKRDLSISGYWIRDFLLSDFKTTPELGTKRLATALTTTIYNTDDIEIKAELTAVATIARNFNNHVISIDDIANTLKLSEKTSNALLDTLQRRDLAFTQFKFSSKEFAKHIKFKQVHLSNGAYLTAPPGKFDKVFTQSEPDKGSGNVCFSTTGKIIDEQLRKREP